MILHSVHSFKGDKNLREVVRVIQGYSVHKRGVLVPSVLDLYFLIYGGQFDAKKFVSKEFYAN